MNRIGQCANITEILRDDTVTVIRFQICIVQIGYIRLVNSYVIDQMNGMSDKHIIYHKELNTFEQSLNFLNYKI